MGNDFSPIEPAASRSDAKADAAKAAYIAVARRRYTKSTDDIEIDDDPKVGVTEDGAGVAAWLWVTKEEAGLCEEEAAPLFEA
jgi:hypothetical protein